MKLEYENDIVFGRFINYMKISIKRKRNRYLLHKEYIRKMEKQLKNDEWNLLSCDNSKFGSSFFMSDYIIDIKK